MSDRIDGTVSRSDTHKGNSFLGRGYGDDAFLYFSAIQVDVNRKLDEGKKIESGAKEKPKGVQATT